MLPAISGGGIELHGGGTGEGGHQSFDVSVVLVDAEDHDRRADFGLRDRLLLK